MVGNLHVYDIVNTPGVAADLGHIDTGAKVTAFVGKDQLADAVKGVDLVIIPAGNASLTIALFSEEFRSF